MSLGERIYRLRTEKNLSQGDLAELLEVSRQSISKWENNNAVPDLEKIIKMSDIFKVSLDELLKGEKISRNTEKTIQLSQVNETANPQRKIIGTILLCMAFLVVLLFGIVGAGFSGIIYCLPFLTCGILCFILKRNLGFWCAWDVYILIDLFTAWGTSVSKSDVFFTFMWTEEMNYIRLLVAWILMLCLVTLIVITVLKFKKKPFASLQLAKKNLTIAWVIFFALQCVTMLYSHFVLRGEIYINYDNLRGVLHFISMVLDWGKIIAMTVGLVFTTRYVEMKK